ncbi:NUDIX hydrolase [Spongisporangium articulatum]|uniref:NUDIX hydrolase n=1 Tax=Spongisporangium articulatum TaxID=3362603 RepID=A0ABW8AIT8_9ACTN
MSTSAQPYPDASPPEWFVRLAGRVSQLTFPQRPQEVLRQLPTWDEPPRRSAVLILFGSSENGDDVLLTRRAATLRSHAGQVAFPGGRIEPDDAGPADAALREAWEETGLDPAGVDVHGVGGDLHVAVTNFVVEPVLGWWRTPSPVAPVDPAEVEAVVRVPVAELADPANRFTVRHPSGYEGAGFEASGLFVWGFTAGVLDAVLELAGLTRPWDRDRTVPLDAARAGATRYDSVDAAGADAVAEDAVEEQVPE